MINIKDINYVPNISEISVYIENSAFDELYQHMNNEYKAVCKSNTVKMSGHEVGM